MYSILLKQILRRTVKSTNLPCSSTFSLVLCQQHRSIHRGRWYEEYLRDLWNRRQILGPDEAIPRSNLPNWNTEAELYAFGKRIGEDFNQETLKEIFDWPYTDDQKFQPTPTVDHFAERGHEILSEYVKAYLRCHFPNLPEEGIVAIHDFLASEEMLAHIGNHSGIKELIEMNKYPASNEDIAHSLKAVLGGLHLDSGMPEKSENLVLDFVLPQLIGVDLSELIEIPNPMGVLNEILKGMNKERAESRLLRSAGANTVTPVYMVGIYSEKELLGESAGETISIAEEMAARDSLRNFWGIAENRAPFAFGDNGRSLDLAAFRQKTNGFLGLMVDANRGSGLPTESDVEPLSYEAMMMKFKEDIELKHGKPYRRRLKHKYFGGSYNRRNIRQVAKPTPKNI